MAGLGRLAVSLALRLFEAVEASNRRLAAATVGVLATFGMWWVHLRNPSLFFSHHSPLGEVVYVVVLLPPFICENSSFDAFRSGGLQRLRKKSVSCHPEEPQATMDLCSSLKLQLSGFFAALRMTTL